MPPKRTNNGNVPGRRGPLATPTQDIEPGRLEQPNQPDATASTLPYHFSDQYEEIHQNEDARTARQHNLIQPRYPPGVTGPAYFGAAPPASTRRGPAVDPHTKVQQHDFSRPLPSSQVAPSRSPGVRHFPARSHLGKPAEPSFSLCFRSLTPRLPPFQMYSHYFPCCSLLIPPFLHLSYV